MDLRERWRSSVFLRDAANAAALFVGGVLLNVVGLIEVWSLPKIDEFGGLPDVWHVVPLAGGCLLTLAKRRHPTVALVAGTLCLGVDVLLGGSIAVVLVMFDLIFAVGLFASTRARTAVTGVIFVLIGTATVVGGLAAGQLRIAVFIGLQLTSLLFVPLWWAANLRQQQQLGLLDAERTAREAVLAERATMARDLHDVIAAHLATTAMHSGAALAAPPDTQRDRAALQAVRTSSLAALEEMRSMILLLRAAEEPSLPGGLDRLPELIEAADAGGLRMDVRIREVPGAPAVVQHTVYGILREALTNAAKHAPGSQVRLHVRATGDRVLVTVTNTLTGPAGLDHEVLSTGTGLWSIRERAALLGGDLTAGPDGDTWTVEASLPLISR
ncbi:sensor histidine kinase [Actinoplanes derwentensis]|uniref:histidine kinase n=1 Tax=Actinoplanes derwentensis TaxID=113562 RepID=A0A1H1Z996_9ACTN|nr:histidine kinase [Actinoplanes derwentensis]GID82315.1 two-component sensor histidine kinase [Actinoplanes derwentensis]SDT30147.1 Signal transduction histidine kinase [Actinoplanes derwentensis]